MWETVFEAASKSGIWAILFVCLFFIQIKDSKTREGKYQTTIDVLAEKLKMIAEIKISIDNLVDKLDIE
ncbi:MAG: BhlA/UviB family holin-like peptide [Clostridia bacterium]